MPSTRIPAPNQIEDMIDQLTAIMKVARDLTTDLSPVGRDKDLNDLVKEIAKRKLRLHNLEVTVRAEDRFQIADRYLRVVLHQAMRELLFNVVKHTETDRALVEIKRVENELVIAVQDSGQGFNQEATQQKAGGFGLNDLRGTHAVQPFGPSWTSRPLLAAPTRC